MGKKSTLVVLAVIFAFVLTGCGALYTGIKTPLPNVAVPLDAHSAAKMGKAECVSYVWLVGVGDCSINEAMKNGQITKVHHVDSQMTSVLFGIYRNFSTVVYGE